jgi:seryl-tRNA synthetase
MLDIKLIRENPEDVKKKLNRRGDFGKYIDEIIKLDKQRREIIQEVEQLKNVRNSASNEIAKMKKTGNDASQKISEMKKTSDDIKSLDEKLSASEKGIEKILWDVPNIPDNNIPEGKTAEENVQLKVCGEKPSAEGGGDFKFLDHVQLGKKLDILDFETGAKISGSGFPFYKGQGAILERALINFMLDSHRANGYTEVMVQIGRAHV